MAGKECRIAITSIQRNGDDVTDGTTLLLGKVYRRRGEIILRYREQEEDPDSEARTTIRIQGDRVRIRRSGQAQSNMLFLPGELSLFHYDTAFGSLSFEIDTDDVFVEERKGQLRLDLAYTLNHNGEVVSMNELHLRANEIRERKEKAEEEEE